MFLKAGEAVAETGQYSRFQRLNVFLYTGVYFHP